MADKIKDLYKGYFQKSKNFLHPMLGHVKRGGGFRPVNTYISWKGRVKTQEPSFVAVYNLCGSRDFYNFEQNALLGNSLFEDCIKINDEQAAYIFNLGEFEKDYALFLEGRYSEFSDKLKGRIKNYHGANSPAYAFMDTYLYPGENYEHYANLLSPNKKDIPRTMKLLQQTSELCSKPDLEKETLVAKAVRDSARL